MTRGEILAWLAAILALLGFVGSLWLNQSATDSLRASERQWRRAKRFTEPGLCTFGIASARRHLDQPASDKRRAAILAAAHSAIRCLGDELASVVRQKIIAVETSGGGGDRDLVGELGREVFRIADDRLRRHRERIRIEKAHFERVQRDLANPFEALR